MTTNRLDKIPNYHCFDENLATAGQPDEEQLRLVKEAGFDIVINLGLDDLDYSLENEAMIVRNLGMEYVHIPVQWRAPACGPLHRFYGVMRDYQGKKLFIHCAENKRVAVFIFLYRVVVKGINPQIAWQDLLQLWQPNDTWLEFIEQELSDSDIDYKIPVATV